jgi:ribosomal 50S subunit-associated protein YjgA (DUF615 family)
VKRAVGAVCLLGQRNSEEIGGARRRQQQLPGPTVRSEDVHAMRNGIAVWSRQSDLQRLQLPRAGENRGRRGATALSAASVGT